MRKGGCKTSFNQCRCLAKTVLGKRFQGATPEDAFDPINCLNSLGGGGIQGVCEEAPSPAMETRPRLGELWGEEAAGGDYKGEQALPPLPCRALLRDPREQALLPPPRAHKSSRDAPRESAGAGHSGLSGPPSRLPALPQGGPWQRRGRGAGPLPGTCLSPPLPRGPGRHNSPRPRPPTPMLRLRLRPGQGRAVPPRGRGREEAPSPAAARSASPRAGACEGGAGPIPAGAGCQRDTLERGRFPPPPAPFVSPPSYRRAHVTARPGPARTGMRRHGHFAPV